jgi:hypothetical protein
MLNGTLIFGTSCFFPVYERIEDDWELGWWCEKRESSQVGFFCIKDLKILRCV